MWLMIVLERHLLRGSNVKIRLNTPSPYSPGFAFQQRECTTSRREFLWKNFYSARIMFSPRMLSRFCFPAGFSPGSRRRVFLLAGSRRVQISRRDSCRDTRREFFPERIPPGKRATSAGSRRDPGTYFTRVQVILVVRTMFWSSRTTSRLRIWIPAFNLKKVWVLSKLGRHSGHMASAFYCESGSPGSSPSWRD